MKNTYYSDFYNQLLNFETSKLALSEAASGRSMTYGELVGNIDKYAHWLENSAQVSRQDKVLIFSEKKIEEVVLFYACLRIGAIYIPLNNSIALDRKAEIIDELEPDIVFSNEIIPGYESIVAINDIGVEVKANRISKNGPQNLTESVQEKSANDAAYMIYTSGSGGKSKGVVIQRKSLTEFVDNLDSYKLFDANTVYVSICPFYFDATIVDLYSILLNGGHLVLVKEVFFPDDLLGPLQNYKATDVLMVPSVFKLVLSKYSRITEYDFSALKLVWFGGEHMPIALWREFAKKVPGLNYVHGYGPSETVHSSMLHLFRQEDIEEQDTELNLGSALKGTTVLVLDTELNHVEAGHVGELYIDSPSVMKEYYLDPNRTADVLVEFEGRTNKVYRTGDLVLYKSQNEYYYRGRADDLVKINGILTSLTEIENNAMDSGLLAEAVAIRIPQEKTSDFIVLFLKPNERYVEKDLKEFLSNSLSRNVMPKEYIVFNEPLPLNANGKIDRKKITQNYIQGANV